MEILVIDLLGSSNSIKKIPDQRQEGCMEEVRCGQNMNLQRITRNINQKINLE